MGVRGQGKGIKASGFFALGVLTGFCVQKKRDNIMSKKNAARNLKKQAELQQELFDAMKAYDFPTMLKLIVDGASASEADEFVRAAVHSLFVTVDSHIRLLGSHRVAPLLRLQLNAVGSSSLGL